MKLSPRTLSILKYLFALTLLTFVVRKVGVEEIEKHLREISPSEGLLALLLASFAQYFSALRMRYFFTAAGFSMSKHYAVVLFYVGAFYNFLLPGGIGGDAYKVILVRKRLEMPAMQGIRIMVADRASGLCIIMLTLFLSLYLSGFGHIISHGNALLIAATIITPVAYLFASKILLKQNPSDMINSLGFSVIAQLFWMATFAMLWKAIGHGDHLIEYIGLYCAASIASMIPVSVGGLGIKEMSYIYGASLMQSFMGITIDADIGVAISLCMFALTFVSSLPGLFWLNRAGNANIMRRSQPKKAEEAQYVSHGDTGREDWN